MHTHTKSAKDGSYTLEGTTPVTREHRLLNLESTISDRSQELHF